MTATWTPERIRTLRARLGLTQHQLADRLSCHRNAIALWETGKRTPTGLYAAALQSLEDAQMTEQTDATITLISADDLANTVLSDLAWAAVGDMDARERIAADHIGTLMLAARVSRPAMADAELVVIAYPGAGNQLYIAADGAAPDAIDLLNDAASNDDASLTGSIATAVQRWYTDPDALGGSLLASPADPYR